MERSLTGLGEAWTLVGIALAGVALAIGFWDGLAWIVVIPKFIGVPLLLAGRHPG